MREYVECYIAIIDLLGFKNAVKVYSCEEIYSYYEEINTQYVINNEMTQTPIIDEGALQMKVASDTILLYIETKERNALAGLIAACAYLQVRLFRKATPILSRGAIVKGDLFAEKDVYFGQGIVDAYLLEENVAKYPRIILTKETIDSCSTLDDSGKNYVDTFTYKDDDDFYVVDSLYLFYGLNHEMESWKAFARYAIRVLDSETNPSIREKYMYIKRQFPRISALLTRELSP